MEHAEKEVDTAAAALMKELGLTPAQGTVLAWYDPAPSLVVWIEPSQEYRMKDLPEEFMGFRTSYRIRPIFTVY